MINFITQGWIVERRAREFYRNELDLANNLLDVFNTGQLKHDLNQLVFKAMEWLKAQKDYDKALQQALNAEDKLTLWEEDKVTKKPLRYPRTPDGVRLACQHGQSGSLEATDCSDLIRLMGAIIEKGAGEDYNPTKDPEKLQLPWAKTEYGEKQQFRKPAPLPKDRQGRPLNLALTDYGLSKGGATSMRNVMAWGQNAPNPTANPPKPAENPAYRDKQGLSGGQWTKDADGNWKDDSGNVYQGRARAAVPKDKQAAKLSGYADHLVYAWFRGMAGKEARPSFEPFKGIVLQSVVGKMERVFGYPVMGADISGTTGDSTYVVKRFASMIGKELDPVMYLLPFATIVASGHHHLLEVAATLTLCEVIDYTIGLYETILPIPGWQLIEKSRYQPEVQLIKSHIATATRNANRMLVYWKGSDPQGAVELESDDWKKVARLAPGGNPSLWDLFLRVSPAPTLADIRDLLMSRNCREAGLEVQRQLAPVSFDTHAKITPQALKAAKSKLRHVA
jgi:hypothetical protein